MYAPLSDLIREIGLEATKKLVVRFGGTRVYLPLQENLDSDHELVKAIGIDAARKLCALWPQERPEIPRPRGWVTRQWARQWNRQIREDNKTLSMPQLVAKWGFTERRLYQILAEADVDDDTAEAKNGQQQLF